MAIVIKSPPLVKNGFAPISYETVPVLGPAKQGPNAK